MSDSTPTPAVICSQLTALDAAAERDLQTLYPQAPADWPQQALAGGQLLFVARDRDSQQIIAAIKAVQSFYSWYLQALTTLPQRRQQGIAGLLLEHVCSAASQQQLALKMPGPDVPATLAGCLGQLGFELTMDPCQGALWVREP